MPIFTKHPERSIVPVAVEISEPHLSWWHAHWLKLALSGAALVLFTVVAVMWWRTALTTVETELDRSRNLYYEGHYTEAVRRLREYVSKNPSDYESRLLLAQGLLQLQQPQPAAGYLRNVLATHPDDPAATYWLGRALTDDGKYEQAEQTLTAVTNNEYRARMLLAMGENYYRQSRFQEARLIIYESIKLGGSFDTPEAYRANYLYSLLLLSDLRFDDARAQFKRTASIFPDGKWQNNAPLAWSISKYNERIRQITAPLPADSNQEAEAVRRTKAGYTLLNGEEFGLAEEQLVRVLQLTPGFVDAQAYLASIYWRTGRVLQAQDTLYSVLKTDPTNRFARQIFVQLLIDQLQHAQPAVNSTEQVNKARDYAQGLIQGLLKERPDDPLLQVDLARFYMVQGQYSKTEEAYIKALELNDKAQISGLNVEALLLQLYTEIGVDPCGRGSMFAERVVQDFPQDPDSWYFAGLSNVLCNKYNLAITQFQKALEMKPNWPLATYRLGIAFFERGDKEQATRYFDMANDIEPSSRWVRRD
ncbi:tetratricopeptide repeat protein [Candidatus Chlorohelix sp.]|uniref:tetratricopeptide repeat protein n=1 Tax=Candidatus Chlorohelix sp. TaxID=3139201 RepID=UPI00304B9C90